MKGGSTGTDSSEALASYFMPSGSRLPRVMLALTATLVFTTLLAMPLVGSIFAFGETGALAELPWFLPVAQTFVILAAGAIAFLFLGRYLALGGAWVYWSGAVFLANAVISIFYLLSWPGLLGDHGLIGRQSNTASWLFLLNFSCLILLLPALQARSEARTRPAREVYAFYLLVAVLAIAVALLVLVFEDALPLVVSGGQFTSLNLTWVTAISAAMAMGAVLAYRRRQREPDAVLGYIALFCLMMAFGLLYTIMGGKRYDAWWYAARFVYDLAYVVVLFGLLQEGYALFGQERARAAERERLLASEQEARDMAERAVKVRDEFISIAAHELKTPVTSLQGFAQLLLRQHERTGSVDEARMVRAMETIDRQSKRLSRLTEQLLNLSRLEAGRLSIDEEETDLRGLVASTLEEVRHSYPQRTITLNQGEEIITSLDPLRFSQVLVNLLDNALKFSPANMPVAVTVGTEDGWAVIAVRDRGMGIPEAKRDLVFERFYQAHDERHYGGMGIGLYISQQIVHLHNGSITVEAPEDGGSRFVVRLPLNGQADASGGSL